MKNEKDVLMDVLNMQSHKMALRSIANEYGKPITHGDIYRIIHGIFPIRKDKRIALGIIPICPVCKQSIRISHRSHHKKRSLIDYSDAELKHMLENRQDM